MTTCRYCGRRRDWGYVEPPCSLCRDPRQCLGCFLYDRDKIGYVRDQCNVCAHELMEGP